MDYDLKIRPSGKFGAKGERYALSLDGEILATGASPLFAACRVMQSRGLAGTVYLWRDGKKTWDLRVDIAAGAKRTIIENTHQGPREGKWVENTFFDERSEDIPADQEHGDQER